MRALLAGLVANIAVLLLVVAASNQHSASGQTAISGGSPGEMRSFDPIDFQGKTDFEISDPARVPAQVAQAAAEARCDYELRIKDIPLHFINVQGRRFVLVFCSFFRSMFSSHQVFDLSDLQRPRLVAFPLIDPDAGFGTTPTPGAITWKKDAGLFEAEAGSDLCSNPRILHVYRLETTESMASPPLNFVLIRVDVMKDPCAHGLWSTLWEAPKWPKAKDIR